MNIGFALVTKTAHLLEHVERQLWFYGITVGQFGFGVLVSRKPRPAKPRCSNCGKELKGSYICGKCGWDNIRNKEDGK